MRALLVILVLLGATPGVSGLVLAQAVPRTDTPRPGAVRVTFDPRIETWDAQFFQGRRMRLGAPLTGDTVGGAYIPVVAQLQQDVRTAGAVPGFVASLGRGLFSVRSERRTTPFTLDFGITRRLAVSATLPLVRVTTQARLALDTTGGSLGLNPLIRDPALDLSYQTFFGEFDAAIAQLGLAISSGSCAPRCAQAQALLTDAKAVRAALGRSVAAPLLPDTASDGGRGIAANIARIQGEFSSFGVTAFTQGFLLPDSSLNQTGMVLALADTARGFGVSPFQKTPKRLRYWPGDVEVSAKYRLIDRGAYAAAAAVVLRLPTGHQDSPNDPVDVATGDHQTDVEGQLVQELTVGGRLWLNLMLRAARQQPGTRERRVAAPGAFLVSPRTTALLDWDPGDYVAVDFAPLYRFNPHFAAGLTAGYWSRARDRYTFATAQDSIDLAARLGSPTSAGILDAGTSERRLRLGGAVTYVGPVWEGALSVQQTVSGAGGPIPAGAVFRLVLRTSKRLL